MARIFHNPFVYTALICCFFARPSCVARSSCDAAACNVQGQAVSYESYRTGGVLSAGRDEPLSVNTAVTEWTHFQLSSKLSITWRTSVQQATNSPTRKDLATSTPLTDGMQSLSTAANAPTASIEIFLCSQGSGWFAVGFGAFKMRFSDMIVVGTLPSSGEEISTNYSSLSVIDMYHLESSPPPLLDSQLPEGSTSDLTILEVGEGSLKDPYSASTCKAAARFLRPLNTGDPWDYIIREGSVPMTWAQSDDDYEFRADTYHGLSNRGSIELTLYTPWSINSTLAALAEEVSAGNVFEESTSMTGRALWLHVVVMFLVFGIIFPIGAFVSRYPAVTDDWLDIHKKTMQGGVVYAVELSVATYVSSSSAKMSLHFLMGIGLAFLLIFQVACGYGQVSPSKRLRKKLKQIRHMHRILGFATMTLGFIEMGNGFYVMAEGSLHQKFVMYMYGLYLGCVFLISYILGERKLLVKHFERMRQKQQKEDQDQARIQSDLASRAKGGGISKTDSVSARGDTTGRGTVRSAATSITKKLFLGDKSWGAKLDKKSRIRYTMEEFKSAVEKDGSQWIIICGYVCDITDFIDGHPGGQEVLLKAMGTDATERFFGPLDPFKPPTFMFHRHGKSAQYMLRDYIVGKIKNGDNTSRGGDSDGASMAESLLFTSRSHMMNTGRSNSGATSHDNESIGVPIQTVRMTDLQASQESSEIVGPSLHHLPGVSENLNLDHAIGDILRRNPGSPSRRPSIPSANGFVLGSRRPSVKSLATGGIPLKRKPSVPALQQSPSSPIVPTATTAGLTLAPIPGSADNYILSLQNEDQQEKPGYLGSTVSRQPINVSTKTASRSALPRARSSNSDTLDNSRVAASASTMTVTQTGYSSIGTSATFMPASKNSPITGGPDNASSLSGNRAMAKGSSS